MSGEALAAKIDKLPQNLKQEALDFIDFLIEKTNKNKSAITPKPGSAKGKIWMAEDFDEPLDEFKA